MRTAFSAIASGRVSGRRRTLGSDEKPCDSAAEMMRAMVSTEPIG